MISVSIHWLSMVPVVARRGCIDVCAAGFTCVCSLCVNHLIVMTHQESGEQLLAQLFASFSLARVISLLT